MVSFYREQTYGPAVLTMHHVNPVAYVCIHMYHNADCLIVSPYIQSLNCTFERWTFRIHVSEATRVRQSLHYITLRISRVA